MGDACFLVLRADLSIVSRHEIADEAKAKANKMCENSGQKFFIAQILAEVSVPRFPTQWRKFGAASVEIEE